MVSFKKYLRGPALTAALLAGSAGGCAAYKPVPADIIFAPLADTHQQAHYEAARIRLNTSIAQAAEELATLDKSLGGDELLALLFGKKVDVVVLPPTKNTPAKIACSIAGFKNIRTFPQASGLLEALEAMQKFKDDPQFNNDHVLEQTANQLIDQYLSHSERKLLPKQVENCKAYITPVLRYYLEHKETFAPKAHEPAAQVSAREKAFSDMIEKHKDSVNAWTYGRDSTHKHSFAFQAASDSDDSEKNTRRYIDIDLPSLEFITAYRSSEKAEKLSANMRQFLGEVIRTETRITMEAKQNGLTPDSRAAMLLLPAPAVGCMLNPHFPSNQDKFNLMRDDADIKMIFPVRTPTPHSPPITTPRARGR